MSIRDYSPGWDDPDYRAMAMKRPSRKSRAGSCSAARAPLKPLDIEDDQGCEGPLADACWMCPYCGHRWVSTENDARCPNCKRLFADDEPDTVPQNATDEPLPKARNRKDG
jgi:hypothetical protein